MDTQLIDTQASTYIYGCLVARPSFVVAREDRIIVYTDSLDDGSDESLRKVDRVDFFNAILTTHVVAGSNARWADASEFRTAISYSDGITLFVEDSESTVKEFVERIQWEERDPILTPMAALMLHKQVELQSPPDGHKGPHTLFTDHSLD